VLTAVRTRSRTNARAGVAALILVVAVGAGVTILAGSRGAPVPPASVIRASASPSDVVDAQGASWAARMASSAGVRLSGGRTACSSATVYGTASPDLYRCTLVGIRRLVIPVRHGTYAVTLFFAETQGASAGSRIFDIRAEGRAIATAVDVAARTGPLQADHVVFTVPVRDGRLDLDFVPDRGEPILSAAQVTRLRTSAADPRVRSIDEFRGPAGARPDSRTWTYDVGMTGWGNEELETYTRQRANAALDGRGNLAIVARRRGRGYTSARLKTAGRFTFRYGALEARIKVPGGRGLWPAFWLLGSNLPKVGWPASGELDVMEVIGSKTIKNHAAIHGPGRGDDRYVLGASVPGAEPLDRGFHVYGMLWLPDAIQFELDGRPYGSIVRADLAARRRWVFDHPFFVLVNLAVGGQWPGAPDHTTGFPATMLVDWIRLTR
jgi:beta-glucanase (GH16 family)